MNKVFSEEELTNIKNALKGWENVTFDQIKVHSGFGLCNATYIVKALDPAVSPPAVFYRKFGNLQGAHDHELENKIFKEIAKKGFGPQCYYANLEYRIEEYIPSKVISADEVQNPEVSNAIAKWLAGLHKQNFDFLGLDKNVTYILHKLESQNIVKNAEEILMTANFNEEDKKIVDLLKTIVNEEEWNWLKEMLPKGDKTIVLCHNDGNLGNIIKVEATGKPMLVDYENCGYNYRGFDIGAFFVLSRFELAHPEPPHIKLDHSKFSTDEQKKSFIRRYLLFFRHDWKTIDEDKALVDDEYLKEYVMKNDNLDDFEAEVDEILRETYICAMLCAMFGIVVVVNMDLQGLPYSKYLMNKGSYECYMELKEKAKANPVKANSK